MRSVFRYRYGVSKYLHLKDKSNTSRCVCVCVGVCVLVMLRVVMRHWRDNSHVRGGRPTVSSSWNYKTVSREFTRLQFGNWYTAAFARVNWVSESFRVRAMVQLHGHSDWVLNTCCPRHLFQCLKGMERGLRFVRHLCARSALYCRPK